MQLTYCGIKGLGRLALPGAGAGLCGAGGSNFDLILLYVFDRDVAVLIADKIFEGFKFIAIEGPPELVCACC